MKSVQCYELFGGIALNNHAFLVGSDFINLSKTALAFIFTDIYVPREIGRPF